MNIIRTQNGCRRLFPVIISILILLVAISVFSFNVNKFKEFTMDDSYIIYRYATNFSSGNGLVFNPGENPQSEGLTSPLWAVILSVFPKYNIDIIIMSKLLGVLFTLLTSAILWIAVYFSIKLIITSNEKYSGLKAYSLFLPSLSVLIYLIDPYVAGNSISGMETSLAVFCYSVFLLSTLIFYSIDKLKYLISSISCLSALASCLLRPESTLSIIIVYSLCIVFFRSNRKYLLFGSLGFALIGIIYFLLRYNYYGLVFPLPFYLKQANQNTVSGSLDTYRFLRIWAPAFPLLGFFFIWLFRNYKLYPIFILTSGFLIQLMFWVFPKHEMGFGYRYFQPLTPVIIVLSVIGLAVFYIYITKFFHGRYFKIACIVLITPIVILRLFQIQIAETMYIEWYWSGMKPIIQIGKTLYNIDSTSKYSVGIHDCGAIPFYSKWRTIDLRGLNNRDLALNYSYNSIINEIKIKKPDILIWIKLDSNKFKIPVEMSLCHNYFLSLDYKYVGTLKISEDYIHCFYTYEYNRSPEIRETFLKNYSFMKNN